MGDAKAFARQAVQEVAGNGFARGEADGMDQAVQAIPVLAEFGEGAFDLAVFGHVAGQHDVAAEIGGEFAHAVLEAVADVSEGQFGALLKQLPNRAEMDSLLQDINQAGLGRGLQFELFKPGADAVKEFYAEMPIDIRVTGGYHELGEFASDVARMPRIVTLNNIAMEADKDGRLKLEAKAVTYRYLDEEEMAQQRQAAKAAKAAKEKK